MGQRHRAVTLSDGTVVYDVLGAEGGNEEDDIDPDLDDDEDEDLDGEEDEDESGTDDPTVDELKSALAEAEAKAERADRRMRRADRAKSKALNELNELKKGGGKELADAREEIARLQQEIAARSGSDDKSLIRDEFLANDKYTWANRKTAMQLLDLSEVDIIDGRVDPESLTDAMDKLANEHPYLVVKAPAPKREADVTEDEDEDVRPSGRQPRTGRRNNRNRTDRQALEKKYPYLAGRF